MIDPVTLGVAAAGVAFVVRALVPQAWLLQKPFSCDLCMSWWASVLLCFAAAVFDVGIMAGPSPGEWARLLFGSTGLSVVVVKLANRLSD